MGIVKLGHSVIPAEDLNEADARKIREAAIGGTADPGIDKNMDGVLTPDEINDGLAQLAERAQDALNWARKHPRSGDFWRAEHESISAQQRALTKVPENQGITYMTQGFYSRNENIPEALRADGEGPSNRPGRLDGEIDDNEEMSILKKVKAGVDFELKYGDLRIFNQ